MLPDELAGRLRRLDWRVRGLAALHGMGLLCVVMGCGVATGLFVDWMWGVGMATRTTLLVSMIAASVITLLWSVIGPLFRRISAAELAAIVDTAFPELGERVEAAVELSDPERPEAHRGSSVMRAKLMEETVRRTNTVDFADAAESSNAWRWLGIGGLTLLLLLAPLGLSREGYGLLLTRFFTPWKNVERATNLYLVIENGERTVARGSDVTISAEPRWRMTEMTLPEYAWLHWRNSDDETDSRRMDFDVEANAYRATLPHVFTSFDYEVSAGSARTRTFHIDVVEAPSIERLIIEVEPPAYTGRPARTLDGPLGRIEVFERSELTFRAELNKPVASAELSWQTELEETTNDGAPTERPPLPLALTEDGRQATLTMTTEYGGAFVLTMRDEHDVTNPPEEPWELRVISDEVPVIQWAEMNREMRAPGASIEVQPDEQLPLPVFSADDIGVAELELHAEIVQRGEVLTPVIADAALLGQPEVRHTFLLDLSQYMLREGDLLSVRARAIDGRPVPGPQEAWTESRLVRIRAEAESVEKSELVQKQQQLRDILEDVQRNVQQDRETTDSLRDAAREAVDQTQPIDQHEQIAELNQREQKLTQKLDQLATVFDGHPLQRNIADATRTVGTDPLEAARQQFAQAETAPPQEQLEQLTQAADELARADEQLDDLLERFDELATLEQDLMRLQQLAEEAEQLSQEVADFEQQADELANNQQLDEQQRQSRESALNEQREQLQTDQESLAGGLDRLLEERPEVLDAARQRQAERLQQLGEQAARLAEQEQRLAKALQAEAETSQDTPSDSESSPDESPSNPDDLTTQQQQLAEDAARLALETARSEGVDAETSQVAREFAERSIQAAEEAQSGLLPDAARTADSAREAAERTNDALHDPTNPTPPQLGEQAEALTRRQQALAEQMSEQAASPEARQQSQQRGQERMTEQTRQLSEQLDEIAQRLQDEPLNDSEQAEQAQSARESTEEATESMQQAEQALSKGEPQEASTEAEAAQEALQQAAEQLGQGTAPEEPSPVPGEVGEQVAEARRQLEQAGQQLGQRPSEQTEPVPAEEPSPMSEEPADGESPDGDQPGGDPPGEPGDQRQPSDQGEPTEPSNKPGNGEASQSMQQVAESLKQAAEQLGMGGSPSREKGKPGEESSEPSEGEPGDESGSAGKNPISLVELEAELRKMSNRDWGRLPGQIESELLQSTQKKPDSDYARLIRLYFEEVSRRRTANENLNDE